MALTLIVPQYQHRKVSADERLALQIADVMDPSEPMPQSCGQCGAASSFKNPLMMRPAFRMSHGGPKGTIYQAFCAECMERRARSRF